MSDWPEVKVTRISSIDYAKVPPSMVPIQAQERYRRIVKLLAMVEPAVKAAPYFLDDSMFALSPEQWAAYIMQSASEIFIVKHEGRLLGFHILEGIKPGRHAIWHTFLPSEAGLLKHRVSSAFEVLKYAFRSNGLGLIKVKMHVTENNTPALRMAGWFDARVAGRLYCETFHRGTAHDMLVLEILNPILQQSIEEPLEDESEPERTQHDQSGAGLLDSRSLLQLSEHGGAELRQLGDEPGSEPIEQGAADGGADDAVGTGSREALTGGSESEWYSVLPRRES